MARAKAVLETVPSPPSPRGAGKTRAKAARKQKVKRKRLPLTATVYERRYVQTVRSVDLWSVLKLAICFYLCALIVLVCAGVMLWWIASATGVIDNLEEFVGDLVNNADFRFLSWQVLRTSTLVGLVIVCILTVMTVVAATFYNLFSELLGGIEITVVEQENVTR
jgi:hypothetical protein